ncbi:MAG: hypothetical protein R3Y19_03805 [Rikenellaceae bacterium]
MKLKNLILALSLILTFSACEKNNEVTTTISVDDIVGTYNGEIFFTVNGAVISATDPAVSYTVSKISDTEVNIVFPALVPDNFPTIVSMSDDCTLVYDATSNSFKGSDSFTGTSGVYSISVEYSCTIFKEGMMMSADYSLGDVMPYPIQTYCESVR